MQNFSAPPLIASDPVSPTPIDGLGQTEVGSAQDSSNELENAEPDDSNLPLIDLSGWIDGAPAWLASAVLHLLIVLIGALLVFSTAEESSLDLTAVFSEDQGEQLIEESLDLSPTLDLEVEEQSLTPETLEPIIEPLALPQPSVVTPEGASFTTSLDNPTIGAALSGRTPGMKQALLKAYGGTEETEAAVLDGLRWLAKQQSSNGSWSLKGPYSDGIRTENNEAATAMALLAFQGAGHLPGDEGNRFSRNVEKGWKWLLPKQNANGSFFNNGSHNHRFYTHAQCTIALCELYAMTENDRYLKPAQKAIDYLIETQSSEGGWKYEPEFRSDLSVTGWVLMALKSGRMAGIHVPSSTFQRVSEFLDTVSRVGGSRYVYEPTEQYNHEALPTMTAEGLLCRQYLGWPRGDTRLRQGVDHLLNNQPIWKDGRRDVYYWYYATQVCRHLGGDTWEIWNKKMRVVLPDHQVMRGRERGSWDPGGDVWGRIGGRLYQTCMSLYVLEVYYRHLPIYQQEAVQQGF